MIKNISATSNENKIKNVISDNDECWFSSHNEEQIITIELQEETYIRSVSIEYQKGFECIEGSIYYGQGANCIEKLLAIDKDINMNIRNIKISLKKSPDLYNRFCIYKILINH